MENDVEQSLYKKRELVRLTGIPYNGMANQAAETDMGNKIIVAIDNLAIAALQNNDTVERVIISNLFLSDPLAACNTKIAWLLTIITNLSTEGGGGAGGGGGIKNGKATGTPWYPIGYCCTNGYKVRVGHTSDM